jgi:hypothetical protein
MTICRWNWPGISNTTNQRQILLRKILGLGKVVHALVIAGKIVRGPGKAFGYAADLVQVFHQVVEGFLVVVKLDLSHAHVDQGDPLFPRVTTVQRPCGQFVLFMMVFRLLHEHQNLFAHDFDRVDAQGDVGGFAGGIPGFQIEVAAMQGTLDPPVLNTTQEQGVVFMAAHLVHHVEPVIGIA